MSDRDLLLLGLLHQQDMHGYRLYEFIENELSFCTDLKKSAAYYALDKMAERGWVEAELETQPNRPDRRVYRLTQAGRDAFVDLLAENLGRAHQPAFEGDVGLAFIDALPEADQIDLLKSRLTHFKELLGDVSATPDHEGGAQLVLEHQRRFLQQEIEWTEEVIRRIES